MLYRGTIVDALRLGHKRLRPRRPGYFMGLVGTNLASPSTLISRWKLNPGGGAIVDPHFTDEGPSGNSVDGSGTFNISSSVPTQISGSQSTSLILDGSQYLAISSNTNFPTGNHTIGLCGWVYFTNSASAAEIIQGHYTDAVGGNKAYILYRTAGGKLACEFGSGTGSAVGSTTLAATTWYHVTGIYSGSTNKVYVNGTEDGTATYSAANLTNNRQTIGSVYDISPAYVAKMTGRVADHRIYSALSTTALTSIAAGTG